MRMCLSVLWVNSVYITLDHVSLGFGQVIASSSVKLCLLTGTMDESNRTLRLKASCWELFEVL